jgi:hypothetical protein
MRGLICVSDLNGREQRGKDGDTKRPEKKLFQLMFMRDIRHHSVTEKAGGREGHACRFAFQIGTGRRGTISNKKILFTAGDAEDGNVKSGCLY